MSAVREYLVVRPLRARTRGTEAQAENQQYLMDIGFEAMLGGTSKGDEHDYDAVETVELVVHDDTGDGGLQGPMVEYGTNMTTRAPQGTR